MFDTTIENLIHGPKIDSSYNAVTMCSDMHQSLGSFRIYFEPSCSKDPHAYTVQVWLQDNLALQAQLPTTVSMTPRGEIHPPARRLLAVHRAIRNTLHLNAAGDYIDQLLRDLEDTFVVASDGSIDIGHIRFSRLGGQVEV